MQHPRSLTRFLCWSLAIRIVSFLSSSNPCPEFCDSLLTATYCPFSNSPCTNQMIFLNRLGPLTHRSKVYIVKCLFSGVFYKSFKTTKFAILQYRVQRFTKSTNENFNENVKFGFLIKITKDAYMTC